MNEMKNDYDLSKKVRITFAGMPYWVMPRYKEHYLNHEYERFSIRLLDSLTSENTTFLDVGAHYGAYTLYAAKHRGSKVIALEPVEENFTLLSENIVGNKLTKLVEAHKIAASDENGEAEFNIPWASDSAGFYDHPLAETYKKQTVKMARVDSIIGDRKIDLIKIDTEGHELHVLDGLRNTLKNNPDVKLIIEANPDCLHNADTSVEKLLKKLIQEYDKEVYVVSEEKFTLFRITDQPQLWIDYIGEHGYANLLCVPKKNHQYGVALSHSSGVGGAELALLEFVKGQRANNIYTHVIIPAKGFLEDKLVSEGISYSVIEYGPWFGQDDEYSPDEGKNIMAACAITNLAKTLGVQFVLNNTMVCPWGVSVSRELNIPLIWYVHEFGDIDHKLPFKYPVNAIRAFIVDESDAVVCCSKAVATSIKNAKANDKTCVVYNPIDVLEINKLAKEKQKNLFSKKADVRLAIVGRVQKTKGQHVAVQALAILRDEGIHAELAIVGDTTMEPAYKRHLMKLAKELDVADRIIFTGRILNPHPVVKMSDIALSCSANEAFGRNTIEAMALGVPVIATSAGGSKELIVNDETGILVEPENAEELANAVKDIVNTKGKKEKLTSSAFDFLEKAGFNDSNRKLHEIICGLKTDNTDRISRKVYFHDYVMTVDHLMDEAKKNLELEHQMIEELQSTEAQLRNSLRDIDSSISWRITKPLRVMNGILRAKIREKK